jgi:hypothetical protein
MLQYGGEAESERERERERERVHMARQKARVIKGRLVLLVTIQSIRPALILCEGKVLMA